LTSSLVVDIEVSNVLLECGLQDSLPGGTLSLKTQTMECEVLYPQQTTTSKDISPGSHVKNERNNFLRQTVPAYTLTFRLPFVLMGDLNYVDHIQDRKSTQCIHP
jgi:hypothetical protein